MFLETVDNNNEVLTCNLTHNNVGTHIKALIVIKTQQQFENLNEHKQDVEVINHTISFVNVKCMVDLEESY